MMMKSKLGELRRSFGSNARWWLVGIWLALQALDVLTTALGLRVGLNEANGIAAGVLASHGELAMYALKAAITVVVLGVILLLQSRYARLWVALKVVSVYMTLVVAFNLLNIALEV